MVFRWNDGVTDEQVAELTAALTALPAVVGTVTDYRVGVDIGENETSADYAVVADFATVDDYRAYRDHPEHQRVVTEVLNPICASRTAVQIEL